MENNSLKNLAHDLAKNGIATLRYDKRGIAASQQALTREEDLRFEDLVEDAKGWVFQLKQDKKYKRIVVIGHSEGSLIGMLAAKEADQFISLAGAGKSADLILKEQLNNLPQMLKDVAFPIIDSLKVGKTVDKINPLLQSLFRKSVQPYLISWFKYDPAQELKKLNKPTLLIQGDKDIQVGVEDAKLLAQVVPSAKLVIINKMNHIFKIIEGDKKENMASYKDPNLSNAMQLTEEITAFIQKK
jgi:pimeloyl-ACP methyl ester carboxylesterase